MLYVHTPDTCLSFAFSVCLCCSVAISSFLIHPVTKYIRENRPLDSNHLLELIGKHHRRRLDGTLIALPLPSPSFSFDSPSSSSSSPGLPASATTTAVVSTSVLSRASSLQRKEADESTRQEDENDGGSPSLSRGGSQSVLASETRSRSTSQSEGSYLRRSNCHFRDEDGERRSHQSDLDNSEQKPSEKVKKEKTEKEKEEEETCVKASSLLQSSEKTETERGMQRQSSDIPVDERNVDSSEFSSLSPCKRRSLGLHASHSRRKPPGVSPVAVGHTGEEEEAGVVVDTTSRALFVVEEEEEGEDDEDDVPGGGEGDQLHQRDEKEDQGDDGDEKDEVLEGESLPAAEREGKRSRGEPGAVVVKPDCNKGEGHVNPEDSSSELRASELPSERNRMKDSLREASGVPSSIIRQQTDDLSTNNRKKEPATLAVLQLDNALSMHHPASLYSKLSNKAEISTNGNSYHLSSTTQSLPSSAEETSQTQSSGSTAVVEIPSSKEGEVVDHFIILSQRDDHQLSTTQGSKEEPERDGDESSKERKTEHRTAFVIPANFEDPKSRRREGDIITIEILEQPSFLPVTIKVTGSKRKFISSFREESPAPIQMHAGTRALSRGDEDPNKATPSEGGLECRSPRENQTQQQKQGRQQILTVLSNPCNESSLEGGEISGREVSAPVFFSSRDSSRLQSLIGRENDRNQNAGLDGGAAVVDTTRGEETETRRLQRLSDSAEDVLMTSHALQSEEGDGRGHRGETGGRVRQGIIAQELQLPCRPLDESADAERGCYTTAVDEEKGSGSNAAEQQDDDVKRKGSTTKAPCMEAVKGEEDGQVESQQEQQQERKSSGRQEEEEDEKSRRCREEEEEGHMMMKDVFNESQVISHAPASLLPEQASEELLRLRCRDAPREVLSSMTKEEKGHLSVFSSLPKEEGISFPSRTPCNDVEGVLRAKRSMTGERPTSTTARDFFMHRWNSGDAFSCETENTPKDFISFSCPGSMEMTKAMEEGNRRGPGRRQSVLTPDEMGRGAKPRRVWRRHHHRRGGPFEEIGRDSHGEQTMADRLFSHQVKSAPSHTPLLSDYTLPLSSSSCATPKTALVSPLCSTRQLVRPGEEFRSSHPLGTPYSGPLQASSSSLPLSSVDLDDMTSEGKKSSLLPLPKCYYRSLSSSPYPSFTTAASFSHRTSGAKNHLCLQQRNRSSSDYCPPASGGDPSSSLVHLRRNISVIQRYACHSSSFRSSSTASSATSRLLLTSTGTPSCPFFSIGSPGSMSSSFSSEVTTAAACRGGPSSSSSFHHPSPLSVSRWPTSCSTPTSQIASASTQPPSPYVLGVQQTSSQRPTPLHHVKNDEIARQRLPSMSSMDDSLRATASPTQTDRSPTPVITQRAGIREDEKTEGGGDHDEDVQGDSSCKGNSLGHHFPRVLKRRSYDIHMTTEASPVREPLRETSCYSSILLPGGGRSHQFSCFVPSRDALQSLPSYQHLVMYGETSSSPCPRTPSSYLEGSSTDANPDLVSSCGFSPRVSQDRLFTTTNSCASSSDRGSSTTAATVLAFPSSSTTRPRLLSSAFHHHPATSSWVLQDSTGESGRVVPEECHHLSKEERKVSSGPYFEMDENNSTAAAQPPRDICGEGIPVSAVRPAETSLISSSSVERAEEKICQDREVMKTVGETDQLDIAWKPRSNELGLVRDARSFGDRNVVSLQNKHQIGSIQDKQEKQGVRHLHVKRHSIEEQEEEEEVEEKKEKTRDTSDAPQEGLSKITRRRLARTPSAVGRIVVDDETNGSLERQIPLLQVNAPSSPPPTSSSSYYPSSLFRTASSSLEDLTLSEGLSSRKKSVDPLEEKWSSVHVTCPKDEDERKPSSSSDMASTYDRRVASVDKIRKRDPPRSSPRQSCPVCGGDEFAAVSRRGEGRRGGRKGRDRDLPSQRDEDERHLYITRTPPLRCRTHSSRSSYDRIKGDHGLPSSERSEVRPPGTIYHREKGMAGPRLHRDLCGDKKTSSSAAGLASRGASSLKTKRGANASAVRNCVVNIPTQRHHRDTPGMPCQSMGSASGFYPERNEKKREREINILSGKPTTGEGLHAMTTVSPSSSEEDDTCSSPNHPRWCKGVSPSNQRCRSRPSHRKDGTLPSKEGFSLGCRHREARKERRLFPHPHITPHDITKRHEPLRCSCPSRDPLECVHTLRTIALGMRNYLLPGPVTVYSPPLVSSSSCCSPSSSCSRDVLCIDSIFHPSRRHSYRRQRATCSKEGISRPSRRLRLRSHSRREVKEERREDRCGTRDHHRHCQGGKRGERESRAGGKSSHAVAVSTLAPSSSSSSLSSTLSVRDASSSSLSSSCVAPRSQHGQRRKELEDCATLSFSGRGKPSSKGRSPSRGNRQHCYYYYCYMPFSHLVSRRVTALRRILLVLLLPPLLLLFLFLILGSSILFMFQPISGGTLSSRLEEPPYLYNTHDNKHPTAREWREKNASSSSYASHHHTCNMQSTSESRRRDTDRPFESLKLLESRRSMTARTGASLVSRRNDSMLPSKDDTAVRVKSPTTVMMVSPLVHTRRTTLGEETATRRGEKLVSHALSLNDENDRHHGRKEYEASLGAASSFYLGTGVNSNSSLEFPCAIQARKDAFSVSPGARGTGVVSVADGRFSPVSIREVGEGDRGLSRKRRRHTSAAVDLRLLSSPCCKDLESSSDNGRQSRGDNRSLNEMSTDTVSPLVSSLDGFLLSHALLKERGLFNLEDKEKKHIDGEVEDEECLGGQKSDRGDVDGAHHDGEEQEADEDFPPAFQSVEMSFVDYGDGIASSGRVWRSFLFYSSFVRAILLLLVLLLVSLCFWATCRLKKVFFPSSSSVGHSRKKEGCSSSSDLIVPSSSSRCSSSKDRRKKKEKGRRQRTKKRGGDRNYSCSTGCSSPCYLSEKELNDGFSSSSSPSEEEEEDFFFFRKNEVDMNKRCHHRNKVRRRE